MSDSINNQIVRSIENVMMLSIARQIETLSALLALCEYWPFERWIPSQRASNVKFWWFFLCCYRNKLLHKQLSCLSFDVHVVSA